MKILFMCVANSARSQMAEGLAKKLFGDEVEIRSAGSSPSKVNPLAVEVMKEAGIDISKHYSKTIDELPPQMFIGLDYVITLCAEEVCPFLVSKANKLRWAMPDPAGRDLASFRQTRDAIQAKLLAFKRELGV